jgi:hypothetical protein
MSNTLEIKEEGAKVLSLTYTIPNTSFALKKNLPLRKCTKKLLIVNGSVRFGELHYLASHDLEFDVKTANYLLALLQEAKALGYLPNNEEGTQNE